MFRFNLRFRIPIIIPILLLLTGGGALNGFLPAAWAQQGPDFDRPAVIVQRGFNFGSIYRSTSITIDYRSAGAAYYHVRGGRGRAVRLMATALQMNRPGGAMTVTLTNNQCAYSLDNGNTWKTFTTGPLMQELRFPSDPRLGPVSTILVRIGGRIDCGPIQQRGGYKGGIRLNALYIVNGQQSGNGL